MNIKSSHIILKDIRLYAYHGVDPLENIVGAYYILNLKITADIAEAMKKDTLKDTLSYADVFQIVKKEMSTPSKLLENVVYRIADTLLNDFPLIQEIEISLLKENPPMGAECKGAGIEIKVRKT